MANTPQHILNKIREAKQKQLKELDLSWKFWMLEDDKLREIPAELFENIFSNLQKKEQIIYTKQSY